MSMRNEKGSMILAVAIFMAVLAGVVYFYSNVQLLKVTSQYRRTQSMAFAHDIASNLAQQIRVAYDLAADPANASLCTSHGGSIATIPGSSGIKLCLVAGQICIAHPGNPQRAQVCVSLADQTIVAQRQARRTFLAWLTAPTQVRAQGYSPAAPLSTATSNALPAWPRCLGDACDVKCGINADCISFKFCPILGDSCDPTKVDDWVTQTVALLK